MENKEEFEIGDIVYHSSIRDYEEPLTIKGFNAKGVYLEGDFSQNPAKIKQREWFPLEGLSKVHMLRAKKEARKKALEHEQALIELKAEGIELSKTEEDLKEMLLYVLQLTPDV